MKNNSSKLNIPSPEELKEIMKIPGRIKGTSLKGDQAYVLAKKGERGLELVEEKTKELGFPIRYEIIEDAAWYPVGLRMVSLTAVLTSFGWGKKELKEIAEVSTKVSFILRIFMRYFVSTTRVIKTSPRIWQRYFDRGILETAQVKDNREGGHAIFRIKNFKLHPLYCLYLGFFFAGIAQLSRAREIKEMTMEEIKCPFRGDPYHEYLSKWRYQ